MLCAMSGRKCRVKPDPNTPLQKAFTRLMQQISNIKKLCERADPREREALSKRIQDDAGSLGAALALEFLFPNLPSSHIATYFRPEEYECGEIRYKLYEDLDWCLNESPSEARCGIGSEKESVRIPYVDLIKPLPETPSRIRIKVQSSLNDDVMDCFIPADHCKTLKQVLQVIHEFYTLWSHLRVDDFVPETKLEGYNEKTRKMHPPRAKFFEGFDVTSEGIWIMSLRA